jgi:hypothetical protein
MKASKGLIFFLVAFCLTFFVPGDDALAAAKSWYVDASVSQSGDGTSWEKAFQTIQEGINAAAVVDAGDNNAEGLPETDFEGDPRVALGPTGSFVDMGADEYYWTGTVSIVGIPDGIEISWDCVWGITHYRVEYADALSEGMTWNTFPEIIDATGLERASYVDTAAGPLQMRFYRVGEHLQ